MPQKPTPTTERKKRRWFRTPRAAWIKHLESATALAQQEGSLSIQSVAKRFPDIGTSGAKQLLEEMTRLGILGDPRPRKGRAYTGYTKSPTNDASATINGRALSTKNDSHGNLSLAQVLQPLPNVPPERTRQILEFGLRNLKNDIDDVLAFLQKMDQ